MKIGLRVEGIWGLIWGCVKMTLNPRPRAVDGFVAARVLCFEWIIGVSIKDFAGVGLRNSRVLT